MLSLQAELHHSTRADLGPGCVMKSSATVEVGCLDRALRGQQNLHHFVATLACCHMKGSRACIVTSRRDDEATSESTNAGFSASSCSTTVSRPWKAATCRAVKPASCMLLSWFTASSKVGFAASSFATFVSHPSATILNHCLTNNFGFFARSLLLILSHPVSSSGSPFCA